MEKPKGIRYGGRALGTPNKATKEFRDTINTLLKKNAENVELWLQRVADGEGETKPDPAKALDLLAKLAEYAAPKLSRTEMTGEGGGPVGVHVIERRVVDPKKQ